MALRAYRLQMERSAVEQTMYLLRSEVKTCIEYNSRNVHTYLEMLDFHDLFGPICNL